MNKPKVSRLWCYLRRFLIACSSILISIVLYLAAGWILGRIPANRSFRNAVEGIEIAIVHNGVHCDIAVPVTNDLFDWESLLTLHEAIPEGQGFRYAMIGWGNRRFYLETPQWSDLKWSTALEAACGFGKTIVHVDLSPELPLSSSECRRICLSPSQYQILCREIVKSFDQSEGNGPRQIDSAAYSKTDAFFEGLGSYHLFVTCNVWVGDVLRRSGVRVGWWTPFPSSVFASLPADVSILTQGSASGEPAF